MWKPFFAGPAAIILLMLALGANPAPTLAQQGLDCKILHETWDGGGVPIVNDATNSARYGQIVDAILCANTYTGTRTPTLVLGDNVFLNDDAVSDPYPGTNGVNAFPALTGTLLFNGGGKNLGRSLNSTVDFRLFEVSSGARLVLENITLSNGRLRAAGTLGGALWNAGTLELREVGFLSNFAEGGGALANAGGTVTSEKAFFQQNEAANQGGAVANVSGEMTLSEAGFDNNTADAGGAIDNGGTLTLTTVALVSNRATVNSGGGILNTGELTVVNSSVSGNNAAVAGGGIANTGTAFSVVNSTVVANTNGGIFNGGTMSLENSILANNIGEVDLANTGTVDTDSPNLVADGSLTGASVLNVDPLLDMNLVPAANSPVLDGGDSLLVPSALTSDLDGDTRVQGLSVDLGAQESSLTFSLATGGYTPADVVYVANRVGLSPRSGREVAADLDNSNTIDEADVQAALDLLGTPAD